MYIYMYIYTQTITEHGVLDWAVRRLNCPPDSWQSSGRLWDAERRDQQFHPKQGYGWRQGRQGEICGSNIRRYPRISKAGSEYHCHHYTILHLRSWNPLFCLILVLLADRMEDQQLQRAHAAAEDLLTESQVSGFASNHRRSSQVDFFEWKVILICWIVVSSLSNLAIGNSNWYVLIESSWLSLL